MRRFKHKKIQLIISEGIQEVLEKHIQNMPNKNESGGILLGQVTGSLFYLLRVTEPNKFDKATRYTFERNREIAQIILDFEYVNSSRRTIYIGEWHTHPERFPTPSGRDKKMINNQFKLGKNLESVIFLIIQGQEDIYVGVCNGKTLCRMEEI